MTNSLPVIAFDLDGTLISHDLKIHPEDVAILTMPDPPAIFVPTTGRTLFSIRSMFQTHQILGDSLMHFPAVLQNGSLIVNAGEVRLRYCTFKSEVQTELLKVLLTRPDVSFMLFNNDRMRMMNPTSYGEATTSYYQFKPDRYDPSEPDEPCSKIICLAPTVELLDEIRELICEFDLELATSKTTILEMNPPGVTKGAALEYLAERNGWDKSRVFCAGDGENDVEMFRRFPVSFTPHTSPDSIKNQVTHVVDISEHGLLRSILNIIESND
jgi:Cof subfamily protein (haloacid dehalogenase superfamily)